MRTADTIEKDTVAMYFVRAALMRLSGEARSRVLMQAGIAADWLQVPNARVPAPAFSALWLAVAREIDDEFLGLDSRPMKVGSFALICQSLMTCANLESALKRMLRAFSLFLDDVAGELVVEEEQAVVYVINRIAAVPVRRFADETFLVLVHGLMCWLIGRRVALERAEFAYRRPSHSREYTLMYTQNLRFDADFTGIRFDAKLLAMPVVQDARTLRRFLRSAPQSLFLRYRNADSWTARIRRHLRGWQRAESLPGFDDLAAELGTAPTTLRRRLAAEGTSYRGIKDKLRSDQAIDLLCHGTLSVDEIAARLGFQDASAFHRAFKRWTGLQPGQYRRRRISPTN